MTCNVIYFSPFRKVSGLILWNLCSMIAGHSYVVAETLPRTLVAALTFFASSQHSLTKSHTPSALFRWELDGNKKSFDLKSTV